MLRTGAACAALALASVKPEDKRPRKVVGVYDRPPGADRKRGPWVWIILALLIAVAWAAYFAFSRG